MFNLRKPTLGESFLTPNFEGEISTILECRYYFIQGSVFKFENEQFIHFQYECGANHGFRGSFVISKNLDKISMGSFWETNYPIFPFNSQDSRIDTLVKMVYAANQITSIPDVNEDENEFYFPGGWYSRHPYCISITNSWFDTGTLLWRIKEGVYILFPDKSTRLIPTKEFFDFVSTPRNKLIRQGDCFAESSYGDPSLDEFSDCKEWNLDRHEIKGELIRVNFVNNKHHVWAKPPFCIIHPEHGEMVITEKPYENTWYKIFLLPGTSKPFQNRGGD